MKTTKLYYWTLASASYDYPACTVEIFAGWRDKRGGPRPWRLVEITRDENTQGFADTQVDRYASGFCATVDAADAVACERMGLLQVVTIPTVVRESSFVCTARCAREAAMRCFVQEHAPYMVEPEAWRVTEDDVAVLRASLIDHGHVERVLEPAHWALIVKMHARCFAREVARLVEAAQVRACDEACGETDCKGCCERDESARDEAADSKRRSRRDDARDQG